MPSKHRLTRGPQLEAIMRRTLSGLQALAQAATGPGPGGFEIIAIEPPDCPTRRASPKPRRKAG